MALFVGISHPTKKNPDPEGKKSRIPGIKIPKLKKIPKPGDKNHETQKIPNPGDLKKIPKKFRCSESRKNDVTIVSDQRFGISRKNKS